ncbi:hypothetical protein [Neisseria sp. S1]|uniref:hypothetical protein n=1 Tax=Neisseria sp. S1 TaxID=3318354 RepID=UPI003A8392A7
MAFAKPRTFLQQQNSGIRLMLYHLLRDMWDVLRLRYREPEHYRYTPPAIFGILLLTGAVNAAGMSPLFGNSNGAIGFTLLLSVSKWLVLARVMSRLLHYYGSPKLPLLGFILITEALVIPSLAVMYVPALAFAGLFWQVWIFWVQIIGLSRMSGQSGLKILIGYIVYLMVMLVVGMLILTLFNQMGWLDLHALSEQVNSMMQEPKP